MSAARSRTSAARPLPFAAALACALMAATPTEAQRIAPAWRTVQHAEARTHARADAWIGEDKVQHFAASAAVTTLAYGGARIGLAPEDARGVAIGAAAVAGLLREVHDHRRGRVFSLRDLLWDALGITAGYFWIREIE